jgi:hypothetical protein
MAPTSPIPDRLDAIAGEIRTTWARIGRDTAMMQRLLAEARNLCRERKVNFDKWCLRKELGIGRSQIYNLLAGRTSSHLHPVEVSHAHLAQHTRGADGYMTVLPVAASCFCTMERLLAAESNMVGLADLWWAEPCAGSGNILRQMPAERRVGFDIDPRDNGEYCVGQCDYRQQVLDPAHSWIVLTNPPFARQPHDKQGGPQTAFDWAARQACVVAIGLIVPHWFQRHTVENRLDPHFHRLHREVLASDSFLRNGEIKYSPALFDVWFRRDYRRDPIILRASHPDWEWLPTRRMAEADAWMQTYGIGFGDIKTPANLGKINEPSWHWFIKEIRPGTLKRLRRIDWHSAAYPTLTTPRIHKPEVIAAYINKYGDPGAPDYGPAREPLGENSPWSPLDPILTAPLPPNLGMTDERKEKGRELVERAFHPGNTVGDVIATVRAYHRTIGDWSPSDLRIGSYEATFDKAEESAKETARLTAAQITENIELRHRVRDLESQLRDQKEKYHKQIRELESEIANLKRRRRAA